LPIDFKIEELCFLGVGYPQYFNFLKHALLFLFFLFLTSGIYGSFANYSYGSACLN